MTQHTPGPWAITKGAYGALHVGPAKLDHPGRDRMAYTTQRGRDLLAQREADAALIAAAPDMLAALQDIMAESSRDDDDHDVIATIQGICRAIITKAKGVAA
jgi:hypothetical protein